MGLFVIFSDPSKFPNPFPKAPKSLPNPLPKPLPKPEAAIAFIIRYCTIAPVVVFPD